MPNIKLAPIQSVVASVIISFGLISCGGSSGSSGSSGTNTVTGQFIDSAVGGLSYSCSSGGSGITNFNGEFTCNSGDSVTFSINGFTLGSASASGVIDPNTIAADATQALNIAQLLQTLDVDNDPSNGIGISQFGSLYDGMAAMAAANVTLASASFDTDAAMYIQKTLVDENTAQTHLNDSIASMSFNADSIKAALAGKTVYPSKPTPAETEEWIVAQDGLSASGSGVDANGAYSGTITISYSDTSFTVASPEDGPVTFVVSAITSTYITTDLGKLYYTQAEAHMDGIVAAFAGKTYYPEQTSINYSGEIVFDASGSSAIETGVDANGAYIDHLDVSYSGETITLTNTDVNDSDFGISVTFTVTDITTSKVTIMDSNSVLINVFLTQQAAYPSFNNMNLLATTHYHVYFDSSVPTWCIDSFDFTDSSNYTGNDYIVCSGSPGNPWNGTYSVDPNTGVMTVSEGGQTGYMKIVGYNETYAGFETCISLSPSGPWDCVKGDDFYGLDFTDATTAENAMNTLNAGG